LESIYFFILNLIRNQINNLLALRYFPIILFLFNFILASNFLGLLPYGFTITSHIIFTLTISLSIFIGITIINITNNQFDFLKLFIPVGVPKILLPFLIIVEFVSYLIRPFSLAVRLFANMLAGHTLLNIMASFVFNCFKNFYAFALLPLLFIIFIVVLEFCIAIVQAYIFTVLIIIYINDIYNCNH
jgi:F-type H+-transporting ATPase subunit a